MLAERDYAYKQSNDEWYCHNMCDLLHRLVSDRCIIADVAKSLFVIIDSIG